MEKYTRDVHVECYAGYRGEQEPRRFIRGGQQLAVIEILDRWLDPNHTYFKVRCIDGTVSMLRHDTASDTWELHCFPPA
jgi:hypothetical protein